MNSNEAQEVFHCTVISLLNGLERLGDESSRFVQVVFNRSL
jgi:hypothetical protein